MPSSTAEPPVYMLMSKQWRRSKRNGPGFSRVARILEGEGPEVSVSEEYYLRGVRGQVKWTLTEEQLKHALSFGVWNNPVTPPYPETGILPAYIHGDARVEGGGVPIDAPGAALPGMSITPGAAAETMLPGVGAVSGPQLSGAAGQGHSGSPNLPAGQSAGQFAPGSFWTYEPPRTPDADWIENERNMGKNLPGVPSDKAPIGAPQAALDMATQADQRLLSLWKKHGLSGSSEYYGVKPGKQTGPRGYSDMRNVRSPIPAQRGPGGHGVAGAVGGTAIAHDPRDARWSGSERDFGLKYRPWAPGALPGANPQVPNWKTKHANDKKDGGTTEQEQTAEDDHTGQAGTDVGTKIVQKKIEENRLYEQEFDDDEAGRKADELQNELDDTLDRISEHGTISDRGTELARTLVDIANTLLPTPLDDIVRSVRIGKNARNMSKVSSAIGDVMSRVRPEFEEAVERGYAARGIRSSGDPIQDARARNLFRNQVWGESTETVLRSILGGSRRKFHLVQGTASRVLDNVVGRVGFEVKAGYRGYLTPHMERQMHLDGVLLERGRLKEIHWMFEPGINGMAGASDEVLAPLREMKAKGLNIHVWSEGKELL